MNSIIPLNRAMFIGLFCLGIIIQSEAASTTNSNLYNLSLEQLSQITIQSSTFFSRTAEQSPGSTWIFMQKELVNSPIEYVKDIFEYYTPATTISQQSFTGAASGVRGIAVDNNAKSLVMYDGQSINQKSHYGYQAGLQSVLFGDIDRVEVIHGPGAMLHGSGAINGIVNFIPKNGNDYQGLHSELNLGIKEKLKKVEVGYGENYGENKNYYIYGGIAEADGFPPDSFLELEEPYSSPVDPTINRNFHTYVLRDNYRLAGYLTHDNWNAQSQFQRVNRSRNGKTTIGGNVTTRRHWQTFFASRLKYKKHFQSKSAIEFSLPVEFFDYGVVSNDEEGDKGASENHIAFKTVVTHESWTYHNFAYGAGVGRRGFRPLKQYFESDKSLSEESLKGNLNEVEFFVEDIWDVSDALSVLYGIRYDLVNYDSFIEPETGNASTISPKDLSATTIRLALSKQINDKQTFKISYQEGFRYPDVAYFLTHGLANNGLASAGLEQLPELRPETIKSFEINYLHKLSKIHMNWELNVYYNIHDGTIDWKDYTEAELGTARYNVARSAIGFGPGAFTNASGTFNAYGFEILNRWQLGDKMSFRSSYAYSRPSGFNKTRNTNLNLVNESNNQWASYPEHLFKLAFDYALKNNFTFNLTTYFASNVDICLENCAVPTAAAKFHGKNRIRVNSKMQYHYNDKTTFTITVQNLFQNDGPAVGYESRSGTGKEAGLGDDARRFYLSMEMNL